MNFIELGHKWRKCKSCIISTDQTMFSFWAFLHQSHSILLSSGNWRWLGHSVQMLVLTRRSLNLDEEFKTQAIIFWLISPPTRDWLVYHMNSKFTPLVFPPPPRTHRHPISQKLKGLLLLKCKLDMQILGMNQDLPPWVTQSEISSCSSHYICASCRLQTH